MIEIINDTKKYFNQYFDVKDLPETKKNEKHRTCNVTCVAMITGIHPDIILKDMMKIYGRNDKYMWEEHLLKYLKSKGFKSKPITKLAWPRARHITDKELEKMRDEIKKGRIIFYHKKGHYQLMVGYGNEGTYYIFNDPAGDRTIPIKKRRKKSGHNVKYTDVMISREMIYGRCWSIKI
jgi:hypothetical protein